MEASRVATGRKNSLHLEVYGDGTQPSPSFEEGLNVQRILDAVAESAAAGGALLHLPGTSANANATEPEGA